MLKLYGAEYFTESEWIKIDGLIHKGKYVFTSGPPQETIHSEGELISFDDSEEKGEITSVEAVNVPSAASSESADFVEEPEPLQSSAGTPADLSDDEAAPKPSTDISTDMFDFSDPSTQSTPTISLDESEPPAELKATSPIIANAAPADSSIPANSSPAESTTPVDPAPALSTPLAEDTPSNPEEPFEAVIPSRDIKPLPAAGGFALGYTQAQLEELKAFNASHKKRLTHPDWADDAQYASHTPTATEREVNIQSWASEVDDLQSIHSESRSAAPSISSPFVSQPTSSPASRNAKVALYEKFQELHGRAPRHPNELMQPNNPAFRSLVDRPASSASSVKTAQPANTPKEMLGGALKLPVGTVLAAQKSCPRKGIQIKVDDGDKIRLLKYVSGVMYLAKNLRTGTEGQVSENIFRRVAVTGKPTPQELIQQQRALVQRAAPMESNLDRVEDMNSCEWEQESVVSRQSLVSRPMPPPAKKLGGLNSSRYAVLADDSKSVTSEQQQQGVSREEMVQIIDASFARLAAAQQATLAANRVADTRQGRSRSKISLKSEPLQFVAPKTNTCWMWAHKGCRFTEEECRDVHAYVAGDGSNLHMGKPTWAAIGDVVPQTPLQPATKIYSTAPLNAGFPRESAYTKLTCWYWANQNSCSNTEAECKFAHAFSDKGVAPRPHQIGGRKFGVQNWSRWAAKDGSGVEERTWGAGSETNGWGDKEVGEEGEFVLDAVENDDGWGSRGAASASGPWAEEEEEEAKDDGEWEVAGAKGKKYKPPQVRAASEAPLW